MTIKVSFEEPAEGSLFRKSMDGERLILNPDFLEGVTLGRERLTTDQLAVISPPTSAPIVTLEKVCAIIRSQGTHFALDGKLSVRGRRMEVDIGKHELKIGVITLSMIVEEV